MPRRQAHHRLLVLDTSAHRPEEMATVIADTLLTAPAACGPVRLPGALERAA
ncbi:hypothetical protein ABZ490_44080 [Streptomyces sp. NPDC005811]|uniref:hypothetical protein n=1 Tax=Streptomyces sp. NPDC005811 TaxID=3154565 RepID=UPI0033D9F690